MIGDVLAIVAKPEETSIQEEGCVQWVKYWTWPVAFFARAEAPPELCIDFLVLEIYGPARVYGIAGGEFFGERLDRALNCDRSRPSFDSRASALIEAIENKIQEQGLRAGEMFLWSAIYQEGAA